MFVDSLSAMKEDKNIAKKKIANRMVRLDAAHLYNSWYLGGKSILGIKVPCTDIRLGGPKNLLDANRNLFDSWRERPIDAIEWSKERYDAAAKYLTVWDVDFEWTIAQHEVGAKFAAEHCKKEKSGENPFQNICIQNGSDSLSEQSKPVKGAD